HGRLDLRNGVSHSTRLHHGLEILERRMENHRSLSLTHILPLLLLCTLATACGGSIESPQPVDQDGNPIPLPDPYDRWLLVRNTTPEPGPVSLRPTIEVTFNDYINP